MSFISRDGKLFCRRGHELTQANIYVYHSTANGPTRQCQTCIREKNKRYAEDVKAGRRDRHPNVVGRYNRFLKRYGLTDESYQVLVKAHRGRCAICSAKQKLYVDHCHVTGRVRGLLCMGCNTGVGHLRDSPRLLRLAIAYLEKR